MNDSLCLLVVASQVTSSSSVVVLYYRLCRAQGNADSLLESKSCCIRELFVQRSITKACSRITDLPSGMCREGYPQDLYDCLLSCIEKDSCAFGVVLRTILWQL
jgi:hypothetical protein